MRHLVSQFGQSFERSRWFPIKQQKILVIYFRLLWFRDLNWHREQGISQKIPSKIAIVAAPKLGNQMARNLLRQATRKAVSKPGRIWNKDWI